MTPFSEHRLLYRKVSDFRRFSGGTPADHVQSLKERDRTLIRKKKESQQASLRRQRSEGNQVTQLNKQNAGQGTTFRRRSDLNG